MQTVIITDRHTTPLFAEYRRMFAPFLVDRGGSVCQCSWHEGGNDIENAVPELYKAIKGHPEWRAIIFIHPSPNKLTPFNLYNPFDFECNRSDEFLIKRNPADLVRLTHMLAGYPSLGVKGYEIGYSCYNPKTCKNDCTYNNGRCVLQRELDELSENERRKLDNKCGGKLKQRLIEIDYTPDEKAEYKNLTETYSFNENRPVEILILTTRMVYEQNSRETIKKAIRRAWEFRVDEESSDFWKVYPNSCRFLCYDLLNKDHTWYPRDLWRLFLLTLTLAINQFPGQALQAYRLYKAELKIDADDLERVLNEHNENLLSVQEIIQERMQRLPELTQSKKKDPVQTQDISVKFEHIDEGDVRATDNKFGLASDCPVSEIKSWNEYIQNAKQTIDNILFTPREIVRDKASETRKNTNDFSDREQVLDTFQEERIRKRIEDIEPEVINTNVYGLLDTDKHKITITEAGNDIRKFMKYRLTKRNIFLISLFSLLVYLCGYIPYLINSASINWLTFGAALGLAFISIVFLAAGGLLVLWFMRCQLKKIIKKYNEIVRDIFDNVNKSADVFSKYFSNICTYMYARSLISGIELKNNNDYTEKKMLKAHLFSIKRKVKKNMDICSLYNKPINNSLIIHPYADITESLLLELPSTCQLYELSRNKNKNTLKLENTGKMFDAPYSFISAILFKNEEVYSKGGE